MIEEYFNLNEDNKKEEEKKLKRNINPDEVIAEGAALVANFGYNIYENINSFIDVKIFEITSLSIKLKLL